MHKKYNKLFWQIFFCCNWIQVRTNRNIQSEWFDSTANIYFCWWLDSTAHEIFYWTNNFHFSKRKIWFYETIYCFSGLTLPSFGLQPYCFVLLRNMLIHWERFAMQSSYKSCVLNGCYCGDHIYLKLLLI